MRPEDKQNDPMLDKIIADIRDEQIDPAAVQSAAGRVWSRLRTHSSLRSCADFQALIPDYRAGRLSEARQLLLKDHTRECVACRKALAGRKPEPVPISRPRFAIQPFRWAIAAAFVLVVGLTAWTVWNHYGPAAAGGRVVIQAMDGTLYHVSDEGIRPAAIGEEFNGGAELRTAKDARAILRLADGSLVEVRERSGLSVSAARKDTTVHLGRGSIIVQAAKRRSGHLYVQTRDCKVAVTGTVFSVNSGVKGSRVSVIEGEVRVSRGRTEKLLRPGEQFSSDPSMTPVPVGDEIAWSRNLDQHLALLQEFSVLRDRLEQVHLPGVRYSSRLINLVPAQTALYASIPNLGQALSEAQQIFRQRVQESPALHQWWEQKMEGSKAASFEQAIEKIRALSDFLGEEIVIAVSLDAAGKLQDPIILAEVRRPGLREFLKTEAPELDTSGRLLLRPDLVAISPNTGTLQQISTALDGQTSGGFPGTAFGSAVTKAYREGAGLLFSADLEKINQPQRKAPPVFADMKYLLVEQKELAGKTNTRAMLSFQGARQGVASWLAAPGPLGTLDFVSPDAGFVSAFAIKNPAAVIEELLAANPKLGQELAEAGSKLGVNIQTELVGALGAEFTFALDGPALPIPSWKLAVEVYDPLTLQSAIRKMVDAVNRELTAKGMPGVQFSEQNVAGRIYYSLSFPGAKLPTGVHYTFVDGYLVAGPSRELVDRAIQYRSTGYSLTRSAGFTSLLPQDQHASFSGLVYHNLGPAIAPFVEGLSAGNVLTPEQRQSLESVSAGMKPTLITFYGEDDRITLASSGSLFSFGLSNLMGLPRPMSLIPHPRARR